MGKNNEAIEDFIKCVELVPNDISNFLALSELYLLEQEIGNAKAVLNEAESKEKSKEDELILNYLHAITSFMVGEDYTEDVNNIDNLLKEDIEITWDSDEIEAWLTKTKMPPEKKKFITELTEKLKKKKKEK